MRNELLYKWVFSFMASLLVVIVVATQFRLMKAVDYIVIPPPSVSEEGEVQEDQGTPGVILSQNGEVIFNGSHTTYPEFYVTAANINSGNGTHLSHQTIAYKYREELAIESLSVWGGMHSFKGRSGSEITTTLLSGQDHAAIREAFSGYQGALFAYDYVTGEVLINLSLPSAQTGTETDGHLTNRVFGYHTPGSTMKMVTLICALTQNPELRDFTHSCTGSYKLPSGGEVTCEYVHGSSLSMSDAIGHSCNCYFAALIGQLDVEETCEILQSLGFNTKEEKALEDHIDRLVYRKGYASFNSNSSFDSVWRLIGQGSTVSLVDMARIAGAVANGGSSAKPYIIEQIYDPDTDTVTHQAAPGANTELMSSSVADTLFDLWSRAVEERYYTRKTPLDNRVTLAKSGTSEHIDAATGEEYNNRLLVGVMEEHDVAFMLMVEHLPAGDSLIVTIANTLAQVIDNAGR